MDKEDCIHVLLSTLQKPLWKSCGSVTDWDLKNILWGKGILLSPDQVSALLADMKRRGLIAARDRRVDNRIVSMWGVRITPAGEEWVMQRSAGQLGGAARRAEGRTSNAAARPEEAPSRLDEARAESHVGPDGTDILSARPEQQESPRDQGEIVPCKSG
jgi:hypothetical protein